MNTAKEKLIKELKNKTQEINKMTDAMIEKGNDSLMVDKAILIKEYNILYEKLQQMEFKKSTKVIINKELHLDLVKLKEYFNEKTNQKTISKTLKAFIKANNL